MELHNEAGNIALVFRGMRCWPSEYVPLGHLQSTGASSMATESLTIHCETWIRDTSVPEPQEQ